MKDYVQFQSILINPSLLPIREVIGRDDRIWTRDLKVMSLASYQTALLRDEELGTNGRKKIGYTPLPYLYK